MMMSNRVKRVFKTGYRTYHHRTHLRMLLDSLKFVFGQLSWLS